jgi:hypothetical protein
MNNTAMDSLVANGRHIAKAMGILGHSPSLTLF